MNDDTFPSTTTAVSGMQVYLTLGNPKYKNMSGEIDSWV